MPEQPVKIQPIGYRYEKDGHVALTVKPSNHYRKKGYKETLAYPGPTVEAIGNELLASRKRESDLATLVGRLSLELLALVNKP